MTRLPDYTKTSTDQLKRKLKFHNEDRGCMTMEQECTRMVVVDALAGELQARGLDPWS